LGGEFPANTYVKYNLSVTFCSVPFTWAHVEKKTREWICTISCSKMREISQGCAFWGVLSKNFYPHPTISQVPKILHYKSCFSLKTRINLRGSDTKICVRIGNVPSWMSIDRSKPANSNCRISQSLDKLTSQYVVHGKKLQHNRLKYTVCHTVLNLPLHKEHCLRLMPSEKLAVHSSSTTVADIYN